MANFSILLLFSWNWFCPVFDQMADQSLIFGNTMGVKQPCALCLCSEGAARLATLAGGVQEGRRVLRRGLWALGGLRPGKVRVGGSGRRGRTRKGGLGEGAPPSPGHTPRPPEPHRGLALLPRRGCSTVLTGRHPLLLPLLAELSLALPSLPSPPGLGNGAEAAPLLSWVIGSGLLGRLLPSLLKASVSGSRC